MAFDPTPWFVGGGAQHSPEVARLIAYLAAQGAEGVIGSGDLRVTALDVPGASVRVLPGACSILARHSGGSYQSYAARMPSETVVSIAPTDASGARSDLIVARVEDPFAPGTVYTAPADPTTGQYVHVRVIPGVSSSATTLPAGETGIVLARVTLPANTGTVTAAHITDLRTLPNPRRSRVVHTISPTSATDWTTVMADRLSQGSIVVPSWATAAYLRGDAAGLVVLTGVGNVFMRAGLGTLFTQETAVTEEPGRRIVMMTAGRLDIPASMRGTSQTLRIQGRKHADTTTVRQDTYTTGIIDIEFVEEKV